MSTWWPGLPAMASGGLRLNAYDLAPVRGANGEALPPFEIVHVRETDNIDNPVYENSDTLTEITDFDIAFQHGPGREGAEHQPKDWKIPARLGRLQTARNPFDTRSCWETTSTRTPPRILLPGAFLRRPLA